MFIRICFSITLEILIGITDAVLLENFCIPSSLIAWCHMLFHLLMFHVTHFNGLLITTKEGLKKNPSLILHLSGNVFLAQWFSFIVFLIVFPVIWFLYFFIKTQRSLSNLPDLNQSLPTLLWLSSKISLFLVSRLFDYLLLCCLLNWTDLGDNISRPDYCVICASWCISISVIWFCELNFDLLRGVSPDPGTWLWEMQKSFSWLNVSPGFQGHSRWNISHFFMLFLYFVIIFILWYCTKSILIINNYWLL